VHWQVTGLKVSVNTGAYCTLPDIAGIPQAEHARDYGLGIPEYPFACHRRTQADYCRNRTLQPPLMGPDQA
jgi:hypothetical protein